MAVTFEQALSIVRKKFTAARTELRVDTLPLERLPGRFLAEDVTADRDYPPFHRSTRDGYAVRHADVQTVPVLLNSLGEVRAGEFFAAEVGHNECVHIMTGAPLPRGANAVVMVEHAHPRGQQVELLQAARPWENVVQKGSEAAQGRTVLGRGRRLGAGEIGLLASLGRTRVKAYVQPVVAILSTGDELVRPDQQPEWFQIRNSNAASLSAQVTAVGGLPRQLGIAPDAKSILRDLITQGLETDFLLLSGGVSMGKYDLVEEVLGELGAEFYFQGVAIRPGKPVVFGRLREKFFFGLPGNPVSGYVTFELFVRPALEILQGGQVSEPVFLRARLGSPHHHKGSLTTFMPARVEREDGHPIVRLVGWQGSGDLVGVAAANCFLVVHPEQVDLAAGDWVDVLPKLS